MVPDLVAAALPLSRYRVGVSTASPRRPLPFLCADDASSILGTHDGISSWMLHVSRERSGPEQRFVSAHERLHHELHSTTPWGFVMSVVGGRAVPEARMVWRWLAESSRTSSRAPAGQRRRLSRYCCRLLELRS